MTEHSEILRAAAEWLDANPVVEVNVLLGNSSGSFQVRSAGTNTWRCVTHWNKGDDPVARIKAKLVPTAAEALDAWMHLLACGSMEHPEYTHLITCIGRYLQAQRNRENGTAT